MTPECTPSDRQSQANTLLTALRGQQDCKELLQTVYQHFDLCVDAQLKYHAGDIKQNRRQRKRRPKERSYSSHIRSETQDDLTDRRQALWAAMAEAVARIVRMTDERFAQIADFDLYVSAEIRSQGNEAKLADESHIRPPQSTNSTRRNRKDEFGNPAPQEKHPTLYRRQVDALPDEPADTPGQLDEAASGSPLHGIGEDGKCHVPASQAKDRGGRDVEETIEIIATTDEERAVLSLLIESEDCAEDEIQATTGLSNHAVREIKKVLRLRLREEWGDKFPKNLIDKLPHRHAS